MNRIEFLKTIIPDPSPALIDDFSYLCSFDVPQWEEHITQSLRDSSNPHRVIVAFSQFLKNHSHPRAVIEICISHPKRLRFFERIFAQSPLLTEFILKKPECVEEIWSDTERHRSLKKEEWLSRFKVDDWITVAKPEDMLSTLQEKGLITSTGKDWDLKKFKLYLRKLHKKALLRIATRDIVEHQNVLSIAEELSSLADAHLHIALTITRAILTVQFGTPTCSTPENHTAHRCQFVVLAMGKLGGRELNFSSDIDLLFLYEGDGETTGGTKGCITNREYFSKVGTQLILLLSEHTEEGILYRVDMRLRPYGRVGSLAETVPNAVDYYYQFGRAWERQSLVKCRPCVGDITLGEQFLEMMRSFIYPKFFDDKTLEDIHQTKLLLEKQIAEHGQMNYEVKLGPGGIRDIEFTVQLLQMLNGGRNPVLRTTNTAQAIIALMEQGYLKPFDGETLLNNYCFLRQVEHRLQIEYGTQKHTLPQNPEDLEEFAKRLGYFSGDAFLRVYRQKTQQVREVLKQFLAVKKTGTLWTYDLVAYQTDGKESSEKLKEYGFQDVTKAREIFQLLANGAPDNPIPLHVREDFIAIVPDLCAEFSRLGNPDECLNQFQLEISKLKTPGVIYALLRQNRKLCSFFAKLVCQAPAISDIWVKDPSCIEVLLQEELIGETISTQTLHKKLKEYKSSVFPQSAYYKLKDTEWLRIALGDLLGTLNTAEVCNQLTLLAEVILHEIAEESLELTKNKLGPLSTSFAIIGLGKLGGWEMTFGSDLDLIFLYKESSSQSETANTYLTPLEFFSHVTAEIIRRLKEPTPYGILYDVDARLRPYGSKGVLVISDTQMEEYYTAHAEIWEKLALMKARVIHSTDEKFTSRLQHQIQRLAFHFPVIEADLHRAEYLRQKMVQSASPWDIKKSEGGNAELEYILRWWQRMYVEQFPQLMTPSVVHALDIFNTILPQYKDQWNFMRDTFLTNLKILNRFRLLTAAKNTTLTPQFIHQLPQLLSDLPSNTNPEEYLTQLKAKVHHWYEETLKTVTEWILRNHNSSY